MNAVISAVSTFFVYALMALFAQNTVLARGTGVSRLVQLVGDDDTSSLLFGLLLSVICVLNAPLSWLIGTQLNKLELRAMLRPLVFVACTFAVCGLLWLVLTCVQNFPYKDRLLKMLPNAGFNTCVVGAMLVTTVQRFTLAQTIGYSLGSGVGYLIAVLMVAEARRRLRSSAVPGPFRGLPTVMIYIGILAMAVYGFTGHTVAI